MVFKITFSHIVDGQRVPLLDTEGREITLIVEAEDKTAAVNSEAVKTFVAGLTGKEDVRVRGALELQQQAPTPSRGQPRVLSFSHILNDQRVPLLDELGRVITLVVNAETKTSAIHHPDVAAFCTAKGNDCRVRRVD